jgi:hypothetical protein
MSVTEKQDNLKRPASVEAPTSDLVENEKGPLLCCAKAFPSS